MTYGELRLPRFADPTPPVPQLQPGSGLRQVVTGPGRPRDPPDLNAGGSVASGLAEDRVARFEAGSDGFHLVRAAEQRADLVLLRREA